MKKLSFFKKSNLMSLKNFTNHLPGLKNLKASALLLGSLGILSLSSCEKDDEAEKTIGMFSLTIENVTAAKDYFASGTTEGIGPGGSYSFSFDAGKGHYLSLATMLAQTNDLFYGFKDMGIELYDGSGMALTGDVTDQIYLWDAGTEVNEEPGVGLNQAPRQSGANTGTTENGMVKKIEDVNDGFTYPSVADVVKVMIAHDGASNFTITLYNMSDNISLMGPLAPGVWVVHASGIQLFTENMDASAGLEKLSEDGNNTDLADVLSLGSGLVSPFAPGVFAVYSGSNPVFLSGQASSSALEALAEDGDPSGFDFAGNSMVSEWDAFSVPAGGSGGAPLFPGDKYEVQFMASPGDYLSFATMFVQSNDLFVGPEGISLFDGETPKSGNITMYLKLWDAKTELNEFPGAGANQAPRQSGGNTGMNESGSVGVVNDSYNYPALSDVIKVTLSVI